VRAVYLKEGRRFRQRPARGIADRLLDDRCRERASRLIRVTVTTSPGARRSRIRRSSRRSARVPVTFSRQMF